jgi:phospholipid/cholesterol/gamma-HCH transport system permease protein
MKKYFDNIIKVIKAFLIEVGEISYFAKRFFKEFLFPPYEFKEILKQC